MPAFNIGSAVEQLDWDFRGIKPDGNTFPDWPAALAGAYGTLREPSDAMIGTFLEGMKNLYRDAEKIVKAAEGVATPEGGSEPDPDKVLDMLDMVSGDQYVALMHQLNTLYAGLCSGSPTLEQIEALPMRGRTAFYVWVMEEVVRPEAASAGGAQVLTLPRTAATGQ
jgi:hypothetical protein